MTLDENDYLTYQLYTASKTPRVKKARIRSWVLTTMAFLCLTYIFFESYNDFLGYYFLVASLLSLILYPVYSRWRYKRHYKKYIVETYKNRFGEECVLEIDNDVVVLKDRTGESKINATEIEEINEIKDFYFVKVRTGVSLIISKVKTDIRDLEVIEKRLKELANEKGIKWTQELDWKWR